ncbi:MAG: class I SAM-dependent methyltransferase [Phycisphaerales bacterium JB040]
METATPRERADTLQWFHAMDLGEFQTAGRFGRSQRQNVTLLPVFDALSRIDVSGLRCLDIGAMSGLVSFGLARLGASSVVATDALDVASFRLARDVLGFRGTVEYLPRTQFTTLRERLAGCTFDLIVCAGVLYHMLNPFVAVAKCRRLLAPGGLLILETAVLSGESEPVMRLNPASQRPDPEPYTYWRPAPAAVRGMLRLASFDVLDEVAIADPPRAAFVARAVAPDGVTGRTELERRMHALGLCDESFTLPEPHADDTPPGPQYAPGEAGRTLDTDAYTVEFPFHTDRPSDPVGVTRDPS